MKSYHGAELGKFVKSKTKPDVPKRPNASRIAASKEADRVAKLQPPPGFVETGHNPTGYVFPIQAQVRRFRPNRICATGLTMHAASD